MEPKRVNKQEESCAQHVCLLTCRRVDTYRGVADVRQRLAERKQFMVGKRTSQDGGVLQAFILDGAYIYEITPGRQLVYSKYDPYGQGVVN